MQLLYLHSEERQEEEEEEEAVEFEQPTKLARSRSK